MFFEKKILISLKLFYSFQIFKRKKYLKKKKINVFLNVVTIIFDMDFI